jgi:hypothetical protein
MDWKFCDYWGLFDGACATCLEQTNPAVRLQGEACAVISKQTLYLKYSGDFQAVKALLAELLTMTAFSVRFA